MSYRVWWLLAFWALGVGVAIELEPPQGEREGTQRAEARAEPASVAARAVTSKGG
ncbi:MAG: hypothetical protein IPM30_11250 [Burkholderiales bacterium]|jgi:hypothetical protein|nr:hypothetical protein [Burkholderiales bacterium]